MKKREMRKRLKAALSLMGRYEGRCLKLEGSVKSLEEHAALVEGSFGAWANETYKIKDRVKALEAAQAKPEPFTQSIDPIFFNGKWWVGTEPPTFRVS